MPLILCGTPIGNLDDAAPRLAATLRDCDVVFAEDTRRTRILLDRLAVDVPLRSFFTGNERQRTDELRRRLEAGETVGLVTDAGMPSISDPGLLAVTAARSVGAPVTVVPGPSAVTAALAVSGLASDRFVFEGFLPRAGSDRRTRIEDIAAETRTVVFFASPRRVGSDLRDLAEAAGNDRQVCVARELTKLHEELWWGSLGEAVGRFVGDQRGEFTVVLAGEHPRPPDLQAAVEAVRALVQEGESMSSAVRIVAERSGVSRRVLYEATL
ncbi:MAG: 16S rRNA (cytidine(1402)-2'-O)-methyltransferase [Acidimicrobiia bacterium]